MRQLASDIPSEACRHLRKYALSTGWLAKQSATILVHTPELNTARTCALLAAQAQARRIERLEKPFSPPISVRKLRRVL